MFVAFLAFLKVYPKAECSMFYVLGELNPPNKA